MKTWIHRLGSIRIAVVLLVLLVVALAAGTIVESRGGTAAAAALVYHAPWFRLLLWLFAANVALSLADLWPWGRFRIGYVTTHGAMLLILAGALVTDRARIEGSLPIWEGEEEGAMIAPGPGGAGAARLPLPFRVRLDAFEIDYHPGTRRPAMFRSRVTVTDPLAGRTFPAVIEMNRELAYGGYRLFQSGYNETPERDQTILQVSRDPGQPIVFAGYALLLTGMSIVLITRAVQQRALRAIAAGVRPAAARRVAACLFGAAILGLAAGPAGAAGSVPVDLESLRRLPVQHDGRVMPLDTLAREAVREVTGAERFAGRDPVDLVLEWTLDPGSASAQPIVLLGGRGLRQAIGAGAATRLSWTDLVRNPRLMALIRRAREARGRDEPVRGLLREAQDLEGRLVAMQGFLNRETIRPVPPPGDPRGPWRPPEPLRDASDLLAARAAPDAAPPAAIERELAYNRLRPARLAWLILAATTIASLLSWNRRRPMLDVLALAGLVLGFAVMTWGLFTRWQVAGRIPASNMYESLLFLGWGAGAFAVVALLFIRNRLVVLNAAAMSALTMALVDLLPIDPFIHPMPPVLSGTPWLAIHVPIIMVSYSVLALGVCVAHMQIGLLIAAPARRELAAKMGDLLYWYMHVGALLLVAGILTGSIWAASSWGRYWGWDPKEVWSLVAFLAYLAILHGRFDRIIGSFGVAALSIVAFWTILMTYIGVNYVLTAGLHSYGFGGSDVVRAMALIAVAEGLFITVGALVQAGQSRAAVEGPAPA